MKPSAKGLALKNSNGMSATISRMVRIGFEVRLTVLTVDGEEVSVVLTRTHARSLGLQGAPGRGERDESDREEEGEDELHPGRKRTPAVLSRLNSRSA